MFDMTFDVIASTLQWLRQIGDALDMGLELLAGGKLAPQLFPPAQMEKVLRNINEQLPVDWTVSSSDLWVIYREASVSVAAVNGKFRFFIQIPIYDRNQQFTLNKVINLAKATDNETHGVRFGDLPYYLAVSTDMESFIDLSAMEVRSCRQRDRPLCNFHTGLNKKGPGKSCVVSMFLNDESRKRAQCKQKFPNGKGLKLPILGRIVGLSQQPNPTMLFLPVQPEVNTFRQRPSVYRHLGPSTSHRAVQPLRTTGSFQQASKDN